jgi:gamma-glutamylaminecyclotransferase
MSTLLFVYGTLKRGGTNHHYMAGQKFVGAARTAPGFRLYELIGHPGMIALDSDRDGVTGEVWSVDDAGLKILDEFEGIEIGLYRRERVPLQAPFADRHVDAYIYAHDVEGLKDLGSTWVV